MRYLLDIVSVSPIEIAADMIRTFLPFVLAGAVIIIAALVAGLVFVAIKLIKGVSVKASVPKNKDKGDE